MRYRQHGSRRNRSARGNENGIPLGIGIFLIVFSLVIVTGYRVLAQDEPQPELSFGAPASVAAAVKPQEQKEDKIISQFEVPAGTAIDEYKGISVYSNGDNYMSSHGLNFSPSGYYYGYKWQCVEFVKRFYYETYDHEMPDGAGNAKYFFNPMLEQGSLNEQRGLRQYHNGGDEKPKPDDLLVFTDGAYGHVAIVAKVGADWIEVIQQNSELPRERFELKTENGKYSVSGNRIPAGWLRK